MLGVEPVGQAHGGVEEQWARGVCCTLFLQGGNWILFLLFITCNTNLFFLVWNKGPFYHIISSVLMFLSIDDSSCAFLIFRFWWLFLHFLHFLQVYYIDLQLFECKMNLGTCGRWNKIVKYLVKICDILLRPIKMCNMRILTYARELSKLRTL